MTELKTFEIKLRDVKYKFINKWPCSGEKDGGMSWLISTVEKQQVVIDAARKLQKALEQYDREG